MLRTHWCIQIGSRYFQITLEQSYGHDCDRGDRSTIVRKQIIELKREIGRTRDHFGAELGCALPKILCLSLSRSLFRLSCRPSISLILSPPLSFPVLLAVPQSKGGRGRGDLKEDRRWDRENKRTRGQWEAGEPVSCHDNFIWPGTCLYVKFTIVSILPVQFILKICTNNDDLFYFISNTRSQKMFEAFKIPSSVTIK